MNLCTGLVVTRKGGILSLPKVLLIPMPQFIQNMKQRPEYLPVGSIFVPASSLEVQNFSRGLSCFGVMEKEGKHIRAVA